MSLRSMATKLALAFVAAKGYQAYRDQGGMEGVRRKLSEQSGGGGLGGLMRGQGGTGTDSLGGGLGGLLSSLGMSGAASGAGGLNGLLGSLTGASRGPEAGQRMDGLLARKRAEVPPPATIPGETVQAELLIQAMIQAAKADGHIDDAERRALMEVIGDADPEDRVFVNEAFHLPVNVDALADAVPNGMEVQIYTASVMAIDPDTLDEAEYLNKLANRLGLDEATVNEVHETLGKPALY